MIGEQIVDKLEGDAYSKRVFRGVFPRDVLASIDVDVYRSNAYVINTAKHNEAGEHWVVVWINGGHGEYFDSYGMDILHHDIENFLRKHCQHYNYNKRTIQGVLSTTCGYYVIYYVMMKARGFSLDKLLYPFHPFKYYENDRKVIRFMKFGSRP